VGPCTHCDTFVWWHHWSSVAYLMCY
jgi:hypothetical protein